MSLVKEYKYVKLDDILNYEENPRHEIGDNETDTLKKLFNKVGTQYMYNLAKDIYENGLLESNLPVLVLNDSNKKYRVYEGNRRIACLKILKNPELLASIDTQLKKRIEKLKEQEPAVDLNKIHCYITDEENAFMIMERIHSGEDQGRGLKSWTPKEKGVFEKRQKQKISIALIITELTDKYLKEDVTKKISYTTIQRFFNNREIKKALEIDINDETSFTKEKVILINYLIDKGVKESEIQAISITRLFNKSREIEDFFLPIISEYKTNQTEVTPTKLDSKGFLEYDNKEKIDNKDIKIEGKETKEVGKPKSKKENISPKNLIKFKLNKEEYIYSTYQTVNLKEKVIITDNKNEFDSELMEILYGSLNVIDDIIQPSNIPGEYFITYKYYMDQNKKVILWQDELRIKIKATNTPITVNHSKSVLSKNFVDKYSDKIYFEHSEKIKSLMLFLSTENKNGKYSHFINIVSRMFLEYSFRLFAKKVLKEDNQTIDEKSKSLKGFIDYCCNKIEDSNSRTFIKHIQKGRKEATNKVDILQKSVHYYDVSISNDDIQVLFKNLNLYLEYIYTEVLKEDN